MKIIAATEKYLDDLVLLNREVQNLHVRFEPEIFKKPDHDEIKFFFKDVLKDENKKVFICLDEQRSVGYILLQIGGHEGHAFCYAQKWIYIDHIGVSKKYRGKGIGKRLIDSAKKFAKEHQINRLMLDVWTVNENAKGFFKKQGFNTFNERMRLELSATP